jgi:hypothetical protein
MGRVRREHLEGSSSLLLPRFDDRAVQVLRDLEKRGGQRASTDIIWLVLLTTASASSRACSSVLHDLPSTPTERSSLATLFRSSSESVFLHVAAAMRSTSWNFPCYHRPKASSSGPGSYTVPDFTGRPPARGMHPSSGAINAHFLQVPEEQREKGIMSFADVPPDGNMVADLWDRHLRSGVRKEERETARDPEVDAELIKKFKEFRKQPTLQPEEAGADQEDMISISRSIRRKRGSWWQVPKDLPETADED